LVFQAALGKRSDNPVPQHTESLNLQFDDAIGCEKAHALVLSQTS